ncbi:MAG TPA: protein-glutamate O-methyltransferase CheR [Pirellulaceae bacterium]|nr:protein-glutamate O-methyltransferase CheR [Pirellulaceae bacterium]
MQVTALDIEAISGLVIDLCGIYLDDSKGYLIESRLGTLAEKHGCRSFAELAKKVRMGGSHALKDEVINAITTNETLFYRDTTPFEAFAFKALPESFDARARSGQPNRLRIWSAAASTGQEAFSLAMTIMDNMPDYRRYDIQILGTDISEKAIERASRGWFADHEIHRGLTPQQLAKYFRPDNGGWRVIDEVRSLVQFRRLNLLEPFIHLGKFDVVFCRNVAIYFTPETRADLFRRIADVMTETGYLFVGSAESLGDLGARFIPHLHCRSVYYRPNLPIPVGR